MYHHDLDPKEAAFSEASVAWSYFHRVSPLTLGVAVTIINEKLCLLQTERLNLHDKKASTMIYVKLYTYLHVCIYVRYTFVLISTIMA